MIKGSVNSVFLKGFPTFAKTNQSIRNLGLVAVMVRGRQFGKLRVAVLGDQQYMGEFFIVRSIRVDIQ